ncbi:hypothetical protein [Haliangium sp.]|uniref:hypothetical protein n=1 Tax=Haliangium sp. TaxID=2663208 RepID=UPI003D0CF74C
MFACLSLLNAHASAGAEAPASLSAAEKRVAMVMDIGATLAILAGLYLAFGQAASPFKGAGWLHAKLTLVVLGFLALHGITRAKVKRFGNGDVRALPGFVMPLYFVLVLAIIVLAQVKPF